MPNPDLRRTAEAGELALDFHRGLGGVRVHLPALVVLALGALGSFWAFSSTRGRADDQRRALFDREATLVVSNLRSALERPLEVLETSATLFEASEQVTGSVFASFVKPALERHPGVRALEWIPIVPRAERSRFEAAARNDGLPGFEFRERGPGGNMVTATPRDRHLPIYFMEPGHPLVLGFDCASEPERLATAERARTSGETVASERIPSVSTPSSPFGPSTPPASRARRTTCSASPARSFGSRPSPTTPSTTACSEGSRSLPHCRLARLQWGDGGRAVHSPPLVGARRPERAGAITSAARARSRLALPREEAQAAVRERDRAARGAERSHGARCVARRRCAGHGGRGGGGASEATQRFG